MIVHNYPIPPAKGVHQQNKLVFEIKDTVMILSGMYTTNRTRDFHPVTGYVHVERKKDYSQSALVPHLKELNLAKNLSFLKEETEEPASETIAVLKPIASPEEEKLIVIAAKKQEPGNTIRPVTTPVVKEVVIAKTETPKPAEPVVAKSTPPKTTEPILIKPPPPVTKPEPVVSKPVPSKPAEVVVTKAEPPKITPPVIVKPVPAKKPTPADPTVATDAATRKIENIQALYFKSDSLQLTLYDNGEVDGDTVSVIMNGVVIMPKVGLSTNAVKKTIYTQEAGDSIQLVMYAETLGSLPQIRDY